MLPYLEKFRAAVGCSRPPSNAGVVRDEAAACEREWYAVFQRDVIGASYREIADGLLAMSRSGEQLGRTISRERARQLYMRGRRRIARDAAISEAELAERVKTYRIQRGV